MAVGVAVAVAVAVGVGVAGFVTTLKPSEALDATSDPVPAKVADRVSMPVPLAVISQVAMPCALVAAPHVWPPTEKLTVSPESTVAGFCETSVNEAMRLTVWPWMAPFGLWLRLINVTSEPAPQVTVAGDELTTLPPIVVVAITLSIPACAPT